VKVFRSRLLQFGFLLAIGMGTALLFVGGCASDSDISVSMQVPFAPQALASDKGQNICYEVYLSDYSKDGFEIARVEVFAAGRLYKEYSSEDICDCDSDDIYDCDDAVSVCFKPPSDPRPTAEQLEEGTGMNPQPALLFWFIFESEEAVPSRFSHKVYFRNPSWPGGRELVCEGADTMVLSDDPVVISPPFRGDRWLALEATDNRVHHRIGIISMGGVARVVQRYAIDWVRVSEEGAMATGPSDMNNSYPQYGAEILAVAPGEVIKVIDGIPDNAHPPERDIEINLENAGGNMVIQKIGEGRYVAYAHMIPYSIEVREGDMLETGQVIGLLGNSGNSDLPHLHFQLLDQPEFFLSQGLAYVFPTFTVQGTFDYISCLEASFDTLEECRWNPLEQQSPRTLEIPNNGTVVSFD